MAHELPIVREWEPPAGLLECFQRLHLAEGAVLLDSALPMASIGRTSYFSALPFLTLQSRGTEILTRREDGKTERWEGDPFQSLADLLGRFSIPHRADGPTFQGGAIGVLAFDLGRHVERLPVLAEDDLGRPEMFMGLYDVLAAFDAESGRCRLISTGSPEEGRKAHRRARERLEQFDDLLRPASGTSDPGCAPSFRMEGELRSNFSREEYIRAVDRCRRYIIDGDIFQVNLSQRFHARLSGDPFALYRRLREINPAPFAAYIHTPEMDVVSASPERFLFVENGLVQTRPIKGTRPRGATVPEDRVLAEELLGSGKDRAENTMIVDLLRNDLGRVCSPGTVRVRELCALETFPTVFHLTSTVEGRLEPGRDRLDLLRAAFPGGSITGAPKVRAMEIIEELEPTRRNVYTGAIGYLGFSGAMDLNIVIRTILCTGGFAYYQVGGGVVYDSDPELEYEETLDKGQALAEALENRKGGQGRRFRGR